MVNSEGVRECWRGTDRCFKVFEVRVGRVCEDFAVVLLSHVRELEE